MGTRYIGGRLALVAHIGLIGSIGALASSSTSAAAWPADSTVATSSDDLPGTARDGLHVIVAEFDDDVGENVETAALVCPLISLEYVRVLVTGLAPNGPMEVSGIEAERADADGDARGLRCEFEIGDRDDDSYVVRARVAAIDLTGPEAPVAGNQLLLIDDAPEPGPDDLGGEIYVGTAPFPDELITYVGSWISQELAIVLTLDVRASIGDANPSDIDTESVERAFDQALASVIDNLVDRAT